MLAGMGSADYELTAAQVALGVGDMVSDRMVRRWTTQGYVPSSYWWRAPSGRLYYRRKVIAWLLAGGSTLAEPSQQAPRPRPVKVRPVKWGRAS